MQNATWGFERRRAPRRSADALVDIIGKRVDNGTIIDISATGLRVRLARPVYVGERRLLRVLDKQHGEAMRWAQVVWNRKEGEHFHIGLRFCSMRRSTRY